ncbi:DUF6153 family protein [Spirillospora sp. NPDC049024]
MGRLKGSTERSPRRRVLRSAFGLCVLFGLLAMHGFQAASNPADMSGVPLTSMAAGHATPIGVAMAEHHSPHGEGTGGPHSDHPDHPGGQLCLAMLTVLAVAAAILALHLRASPAVAAPRRTRVRILLAGRPPPRPSLHRLSVLRL